MATAPLVPELNIDLPVPVEVVNHPSSLLSDLASLTSLTISVLAAVIAWRAYRWSKGSWEAGGPVLVGFFIFLPEHQVGSNELSLILTNRGRVGSHVSTVALEFKGGNSRQFTYFLPATLALSPGESQTISILVSEVAESLKDDWVSPIHSVRAKVQHGHGVERVELEPWGLPYLNEALSSD